MLLTLRIYSCPKSPKSMTSSLVQSTACFVSLQLFIVLQDVFCHALTPTACFFFAPVQVYCPSRATVFCCLSRITSGRCWSQPSSSSSTSPSVTSGWRSRCFLWRYLRLFRTGVSRCKEHSVTMTPAERRSLVWLSVKQWCKTVVMVAYELLPWSRPHLLLICEQVAVWRHHLSVLRHVRRAVWPV